MAKGVARKWTDIVDSVALLINPPVQASGDFCFVDNIAIAVLGQTVSLHPHGIVWITSSISASSVVTYIQNRGVTRDGDPAWCGHTVQSGSLFTYTD